MFYDPNGGGGGAQAPGPFGTGVPPRAGTNRVFSSVFGVCIKMVKNLEYDKYITPVNGRYQPG